MVLAGWASLLVLGVAATLQVQPAIQPWLESYVGVKQILKPGASAFNLLTDFAMFGAVIFETLAVATIFVFRRRIPDAPRPYRCWGYPVVPALYVAIMVWVATNMITSEEGRPVALVGLSFMGVGAIVYGVQWLRGGGDREAKGDHEHHLLTIPRDHDHLHPLITWGS